MLPGARLVAKAKGAAALPLTSRQCHRCFARDTSQRCAGSPALVPVSTASCGAPPGFCREGRRSFRRRIDGYLHYYGKLKIQEGMLRDQARVDGYLRGLEAAASKLQGATVMDIGTGSGILAMLAAKCGAKKVYAVEASLEIARVASQLTRSNGLFGVVEVVPKHLEDITHDDIPEGSVDVIVSELFSHFLVGEIGLQVVTLAKKRFLKPGGLVLPAVADMVLSPFEDKALGAELRGRHSFWGQRDFYGFDLTPALPIAEEQALRENVVDIVDPSSLLVPPELSPVKRLDLVGPDDPDVWRRIQFELTFPRRERDAVIDGFCGWWDVVFDPSGDAVSHSSSGPVLSTGPHAAPTVWAQCRFLLSTPLVVRARDQLSVTCKLKLHAARESYTLWLDAVNQTSGATAQAGPIELSNVYARHFAAPLPFPLLDEQGNAVEPSRGGGGNSPGLGFDHPTAL